MFNTQPTAPSDHNAINQYNIHLHSAVIKGVEEDVLQILNNPEVKATINHTNQDRRTALHEAALRGFADIVALLRQHGARTTNQDLADYRDDHNNTLLQLAVKNEDIDVLAYFLSIPEIRATINHVNDEGKSALGFAVKLDLEANVKLLLSKGADPATVVDFYDTKDKSVMDRILKSAHQLMMLAKGWATNPFPPLTTLLANGASLDQVDKKYNNTPLHLAVNRVDIKLIREFLKAGANVDAKNIYNLTPIEALERSNLSLSKKAAVKAVFILAKLHMQGKMKNKSSPRDGNDTILDDSCKAMIEDIFKLLEQIEENIEEANFLILEVGLIIKDVVLDAENALKMFSKISKGSRYYLQAQFNLAEIYFLGLMSDDNYLDKAFFHIFEAGMGQQAVSLRKHIVTKIMGDSLASVPYDPCQATDVLSILKELNTLRSQSKGNQLEPKEKKEETLDQGSNLYLPSGGYSKGTPASEEIEDHSKRRKLNLGEGD